MIMRAFLLLVVSLAVCVFGQCQNGVIAGEIAVSLKGVRANFTVPQSGGTKLGGVSVSGGTLKLAHGVRAYFGHSCVTSFTPDMYKNTLPSLLDSTIHYTVDLSNAGCACNAALYLVAMPAYNSNNQPDPTKCGDYYCDANDVCGINCPEIDIMEANSYAWQSTPHKCNTPNQNYYPSCDGGGCGKKVYNVNNAYGPGGQYTINTQQAFDVNVSFGTSNNQFNKMTTVLSQNGKTVTLVHDDGCGSGYLESLTNVLRNGMVMAMSYWGDTAQTMAWLDIPPCNSNQNCNTNTQFTLSNFEVY